MMISIVALLAVLASAAGAGVAQDAALRERIRDTVGSIRMVDTHEHLSPEAARLKSPPSVFGLLHYVSSDMWADGLDRTSSDREFADPAVPLARKWALMAPYWANVRTTAYGRALLRALRDLYGVTDLTEATCAELSRKIADAGKPGIYERILRGKAGIDMAICDVGPAGLELDPALFRAVIQLDQFLVFPESCGLVEKQLGVTVESLADWEQALDKAFQQAKGRYVAVKSPVAYRRSLDFRPVDRAEAETLFNQLKPRKGQPARPDWTQNKPLQDYMFDRIAVNCGRYDMPLQIHTGLFYDTGRDVRQADPSLLAPLVIRHPGTRFVLMHGGYPYGGHILAMAKNLPNVTIDMCWTYVISPAWAGRLLDEAIETLPADKVLGFGGDYSIPEGSYAHAMLCREVVSKVLADKVLAGYWSEGEAVGYARALLRDNAVRVFKLPR